MRLRRRRLRNRREGEQLMASVWIRPRPTKDGSPRFWVEYRTGGRESGARFAGSFTTKRLATIRAGFVEQELAAGRIPDLTVGKQQKTSPTFEQAARTWRASRVDVAASTSDQHRIQIEKLLPLIGTTPDRHARARHVHRRRRPTARPGGRQGDDPEDARRRSDGARPRRPRAKPGA